MRAALIMGGVWLILACTYVLIENSSDIQIEVLTDNDVKPVTTRAQ